MTLSVNSREETSTSSRLTERSTTSCGESILQSLCDAVLMPRSEMAAKEASQRHVIEQQFVQIADLQRANLKLREELAGGVSHARYLSRGIAHADTVSRS